jgi:oligoendopeptidase F
MSDAIPARSQVPVEDRWDLEKIYSSDSDWERDFASTASFAQAFSRRAGTLSVSPQSLLEAIVEMLAQARVMEKLLSYSSMRSDEDLSDSLHSEMHSRVMSRAAEVSAGQSFFVPEILRIADSKMSGWLASDELAAYRSWLEEILRFRPHTLGEAEEKLLAMSREVTEGFYSAFGKLSNVDRPGRLPEVARPAGGAVRITNANFTTLLEDNDQSFRRAVFNGYYGELRGNTSTLAALLDSQVRSSVFYARARNHRSAVEASLFLDSVDLSVYESLIGAVSDSLPTMHRYYGMKKKALGLEKMHIYDLYLPSVTMDDRRYSFDEAVEMTLKAVEPLGGSYRAELAEGFRSRWVDRYENRGKRSGAYSGGCYDTMPYILHNFTGSLDSVFTLAHEAGHSMHSLLSRRAQPYHTSDYRILLAEVASTTNEMLLTDSLLSRSTDRRERSYLLDHLVNDFRGTVFRQTMFAEFELLIHREVESGGALTPDYLDSTYLGLVKKYHGPSFDLDGDDEAIACEWARIPHFYYNFYVYKYATGLCSAVDISRRIISGADGAVESYMGFLSGGCSVPPLDLLASAGVDLRTPAPVASALEYLDEAVGQLAAPQS